MGIENLLAYLVQLGLRLGQQPLLGQIDGQGVLPADHHPLQVAGVHHLQARPLRLHLHRGACPHAHEDQGEDALIVRVVRRGEGGGDIGVLHILDRARLVPAVVHGHLALEGYLLGEGLPGR